ncbi:hypothetical protein SDC9_181187 [bioreactor metagenome]|uniref:Uncharacterized protein n=1 Tax=bioreactor metagenome TaxID=1076179 RepID=A0A645H5D6_9ZZZZ
MPDDLFAIFVSYNIRDTFGTNHIGLGIRIVTDIFQRVVICPQCLDKIIPHLFILKISHLLIGLIFCNIYIFGDSILSTAKWIGKDECPIHFGSKKAVVRVVHSLCDHFQFVPSRYDIVDILGITLENCRIVLGTVYIDNL